MPEVPAEVAVLVLAASAGLFIAFLLVIFGSLATILLSIARQTVREDRLAEKKREESS